MSKVKQQAQSSLLYLLLNNARHAKQHIRQHINTAQSMSGVKSSERVPVSLLSQIDFKGNRLSELKQKLGCSKQEATRQVQQAEQGGWIVVESDANDKRAKRVMLSAKGKQSLSQGFDVYADLESQLLIDFSEKEKKQLLDLLQKLQRNLKG